jgi:hypothetical protein
LTLSDTDRTANDTSGTVLGTCATADGDDPAVQRILNPDVSTIRAVGSNWNTGPSVQLIT